MYLIGASHPLKDRSKLILGELVRSKRRLVTSAEVLQELCHRYGAIHKLDFLQPAFDVLYGLVDQVFPVTKEDVEASKTLVLGYKNLSARDALHVAVMKNLGMDQQKSEVILWGYIGRKSPHYNEFVKYVRNVNFGHRPTNLGFGYMFDEVQEHHFFDLYSIDLLKA